MVGVRVRIATGVGVIVDHPHEVAAPPQADAAIGQHIRFAEVEPDKETVVLRAGHAVGTEEHISVAVAGQRPTHQRQGVRGPRIRQQQRSCRRAVVDRGAEFHDTHRRERCPDRRQQCHRQQHRD